MTSCNHSIWGHNFILKSNHNYSLKSTLKKYIESVCENKTTCKCSNCSYNYSLKYTLKKHIESVHGNKNLHLFYLWLQLFSKMHFKKHVDSVHDSWTSLFAGPYCLVSCPINIYNYSYTTVNILPCNHFTDAFL